MNDALKKILLVETHNSMLDSTSDTLSDLIDALPSLGMCGRPLINSVDKIKDKTRGRVDLDEENLIGPMNIIIRLAERKENRCKVGHPDRGVYQTRLLTVVWCG